MKKVLYITPAFAVCMTIGTLGLLFGFGEFTLTTWAYLLFSVLGSVLLCMKKWWGCFAGGITGGLIIWMDILDVSGGVSTAALGIGFLVYYGIMGLICYKLDR